jgi:hypothetical protein
VILARSITCSGSAHYTVGDARPRKQHNKEYQYATSYVQIFVAIVALINCSDHIARQCHPAILNGITQ